MALIKVSSYGIHACEGKPDQNTTTDYVDCWAELEKDAEPGDTIQFDEEGFYPWKQRIPDGSTSTKYTAARITKPLTVTCVPGAVIWNTAGGASFAVQLPRCCDVDDDRKCFQYDRENSEDGPNLPDHPGYPHQVTLWEWAEANSGDTCKVCDGKVIPDQGTLPDPPFLIYSTGYPGDDWVLYRDGPDSIRGTPLYWEEIINPNKLASIPRLPTGYSYTHEMFPGVNFSLMTVDDS